MSRRLLITGGSGMVGRNLLSHPGLVDHEVWAPRRAELDLFDEQAIKEALLNYTPDFIIHCAGRVGGIKANIANPVEFLVENLDVGRNVLLAARDSDLDLRVINLGSSCIYPKDHSDTLKEEDLLTGQLEPTNLGYALAKLTVIKLGEFISASSSKLVCKSLIPCNLYGPYDKFDLNKAHLIPSVIHKVHMAKCNQDKEITIWGTGQVRREFMYASDVASSIVYAIDNFDEAPSILNIGWGSDHTIYEYYSTVASVLGWEGEFDFDLSKPEGMKRKLLDVQRQKKWGWKPVVSLEEGVRKTYDYYLNQV